MENPFASLFLLPIAIAILALPTGLTVATAVAAVLGYLVSTLWGRELPDTAQLPDGFFELHKLGMLANFVVSAAVILLFLTRVAAGWRRSEQQVAQLREQFARDEGIVALATHAAPVAHEMNTPLATMTLLVDDMADEAHSEAQREELAPLRALLAICRDRGGRSRRFLRRCFVPASAMGWVSGLPYPTPPWSASADNCRCSPRTAPASVWPSGFRRAPHEPARCLWPEVGPAGRR